MKIVLILLSMLFFSACSNEATEKPKQKPAGSHVWKTQTDAMDKARAIGDTLQDTADRTGKEADQY